MKKLFLSLIISVSFLAVNAQADTLQQYAGAYVFPEGSPVPSVDVVLADGALSMNSAAGNSSLTQLGVDSFLIVQFSGTAVFQRGEDKQVNAVHIEAAGYIMDGKKQSNGIWIFREYYLPVDRMNIRKEK
ncbi:MAG: hypothetical protein AAB221_00545 [Bacteroidota bacterium]